MRYKLLILSLVLLPFSLFAESGRNYYFRHYTNRQGLSHNTVYCSLQDSKGFMWFGTDDGLNRFDGHTFTVFRYNSWLPEGEGLPNDRIISLCEDSSGKIWICTDGGTCYYEYETNSFYPLRLVDGEVNKEIFLSVKEDKHNNLWFSSYGYVIRLSPDGYVQNYPATNEFSPRTIENGDEGYPLVAGSSEIYYYRLDNDRFLPVTILTEEEKIDQVNITVIGNVPGTGVLIGTNRAGLKLYHRHSGQIETLLPEVYVRDITAYSPNIYWIATESGIFICNLIDKSITHLTKSLTNDFGIADNAIYSITCDSEGGVWVGTFFGGISYMPQQYTPFSYYIGGKTHPGMLGNAVREICPDRYGYIWLGTEDNGINRYDPQTGTMVNYSLNNPVKKLSATNIHGLYADGDKVWVGTFNRGIDVLDIPSGRIIKRYTQAGTQGVLSDFVLCFYETREGDFLIGTSAGMVLFDRKTERFTHWQDIRSLVRQIHEDRNGNIWVVTSNGIFRYDPEKNSMHHYTVSGGSQSLGSNNCTSVFEDSKGRIWITTFYGFSQFNEQTGGFTRITTEDGLPGNIIYRIVEDSEGIFWITTANGLVRFHPESHVMRIFTESDGLHETQFNYSSSYKAPDGTIYMGTVNGMVSFNPQHFREDTFIPPMYIYRIHIPEDSGNKYGKGFFLSEGGGNLTLPYHTSSFTLSCTALSYTSPGAIRYAYMLEGVDKDWIQMGNNRDVTFANLSPGKYIFKVRSTNSSGVWLDNETSLHIVITPPFWATLWAYLLYAVIVILLIVIVYNYKKKGLEKKHLRAQEIFENEKEKELYNAKIQFFTFITHEIRTPLTLIKAPLEKIIRSKEGSPALHNNLRTIEKNTQRLLDLSNQLLDFRKTESRGFRLNYVKTDIRLWTDTIVQPFLPVFEKEEKDFLLSYSEDSFSACIDREAYAKILSNLLTNALKYSDRSIRLKVSESFIEEGIFTVEVINDGYLVPENETEAIFTPFYRLKETENMQGSGIGLSLSRSLAEFHTGSLIYEQTPEGLNRFILTLPLEQEEYFLGEDSKDSGKKSVNETEEAIESSRPVVLVVEDQDDMRQFIAEELSQAYHVLEAENGKVALTILENNAVSLIISDVMMPVMDGFELCNQVKNNVDFSHIPFILLTAQHNLQSRLEGLNKGADAYMEKPFSIELLMAQVANLLKNREMLSQSYREKPFTSTETLAVSPMDDLFLARLNKYLEENLTNSSLNMDMVAAGMNMSTSGLYRKVKGLSGLTPNDFIRLVRLKKAVNMMQQGELRINEIAFQVGFSSPAYFSTCFQKQYGRTPSNFMKGISNHITNDE